MSWRETHYSGIDPSGRVTGVLWLGLDDEAGKYLWYDDGIDRWMIAASIGPKVQIDGGTPLDGYWYSYNGQRYWYLSGLYLWYSGSVWIISSKLGACIREEWDVEEEEYIGDAWWSGATLEGLYEARGSGRGTVEDEYNGTPKKVTLSVEGWRRAVLSSGVADEPPAGRYYYYKRTATVDDEGDVEETIVTTAPGWTQAYLDVGMLTWTDADDTEYPRSEEQDESDHYTYGTIHWDATEEKWIIGIRCEQVWYLGAEPDAEDDVLFLSQRWLDQNDTAYDRSCELDGAYYDYGDIHHDGTGWVIGTRNSEDGWWEGTEPDASPVVFTRQKTEIGDYPGPEDLTITPYKVLTISFAGCTLGDDRTTALLGETGLWL